jgi:hypothetical protein
MSTEKTQDWPSSSAPPTTRDISDEQALTVAHLILEGKPKSYVEGSILLARYVVALHEQAHLLERELGDIVFEPVRKIVSK